MTKSGKSDSPCTGICRLRDEGDWCIGCGRLASELFNWTDRPEKERREIIRHARQRLLTPGRK
ncbi:DUF1289 domain-containing protein [Emcibacter sp.]|uniref:DUF1289 domain-containing protein n=1 Tax=Emcibacter sp. TaxID=1979954 RepID=UPI003B631950